jgi:hypothetical protein
LLFPSVSFPGFSSARGSGAQGPVARQVLCFPVVDRASDFGLVATAPGTSVSPGVRGYELVAPMVRGTYGPTQAPAGYYVSTRKCAQRCNNIRGFRCRNVTNPAETPTTYNVLAAGNNTTNNNNGMENDCIRWDIPPRTLWVFVQLLHSPELAPGNMWQPTLGDFMKWMDG